MSFHIGAVLRRLVTAVAAGALSFAAAAFPTKQITIIVPFSAGSSTDALAREFGKYLSEAVKQPVVVDNKVGADGTIGGQALLNAPADGHTVLFTSSSLTVLDPLMKKNMPYDPIKDFAPVCGIVTLDNTVNITGASPYKNVPELVAAAKAQPGKFTFAYSSSTTRLAGEAFAQATGIKLTAVPYRSTVTGLTDVAGGQVDLFFIDHVSSAPYRQGGKMRVLAVSGSQRLKTLPDVPSAKELGFPDYEVAPFNSVWVSSNTPAAITNQLRDFVAQAAKSPALLDFIDKRALLPMQMCGDPLSKHVNSQMDLLRKVIERAGIERQ